MVKLVDVYPDGYEAIVLDSAMRTRYRNGRDAGPDRDDDAGRAGEADDRSLGYGADLREGPPDCGACDELELAALRREPEHGRQSGQGAKTRVARNTIYMDAPRPSAIKLPILYLPE